MQQAIASTSQWDLVQVTVKKRMRYKLIHTNTPDVIGNLPIYERTQPVFTCSKLTVDTLEQGVKYVQS